ncbi:hypothetical protein [Paludisphaera mucosa]|uniref:Uncharacterized protein n=1 Tax=Paludisphaera mucosa TaxID=3030827 RepID=A0ABT6FB67_9BACT|nr:hypothetical protein [Paludisphaera mucosa]MDG3004837.1 hypothetical protein [Paludisphaera mucosa]
MKPSSIQPGIRPGAGFILASLCVFLLAPGAAEARCGGRAAAMAWRSATPAGLGMAAHGAEASAFPEPASDDGPRCSGPSCSERDPSPLPAGVFETMPSRGEGLASPAFLPAVPPGSRPHRAADESFDSPRAPSAVFHPPRRPPV